MKYLLTLVVLVVGMFAGASTATAKEPGTPCENGNPTDLCGDTIEVVVEPPGENCPNGGIKITVTPKAEPEPVVETLTTPVEPPPPPPEPEVFFVCNGENGLPGEPGEPGIPGTPGTPGATIIGAGGLPITVTQDVDVDVNVNVGGRNRCRFARTPRLVLPERLRSSSTVQVKVDRGRTRSAVVRNNRSIRVRAMRGKRCGPHVVKAGTATISPTLRLWTVVSRNRLNRRVLIP